MPLRIPNAGEVKFLESVLGVSAPGTLSIRLFTNNITPADTDVLGTYTQSTGGGYSAQNLVPASWTITPGSPTEAVYPQITWTFTGASASLYGYYVVDTATNTLLWAERFTNGPYAITQAGDSIKVTPRITMQDTSD